MFEAGLLNLVLFLPLLGVAVLLLSPSASDETSRRLTLVLMLVQLMVTSWLYAQFDAGTPGLQFETRLPWIAAWGVNYQIGLDGYNVLLVMLTAFLGPLVVAGSFSAVTKDVKLFHAMLFLIQFAMMGTFVAQDLFLFYVFWEAMMIPMFLIIGIWGGPRRIQAAYKFFFYSFTGTVLMLLAIMAMYWSAGTTDITQLLQHRFGREMQTWLWLAFFASFSNESITTFAAASNDAFPGVPARRCTITTGLFSSGPIITTAYRTVSALPRLLSDSLRSADTCAI